MAELERRPLTLFVAERDIVRLKQQRKTGSEPRLDQVLGDLGLAIDRDVGADQVAKVDPLTAPVTVDFGAVMDEAFAMQAVCDARLLQHPHRAVFEDAGPDAVLHITPRTPFDDDGFDPAPAEQLAEQKSRRSAADDCDLCSCPDVHLTSVAELCR